MTTFDTKSQAENLLRRCGSRAGQIAVDFFGQAVRDFDMRTARMRERVAVLIDR